MSRHHQADLAHGFLAMAAHGGTEAYASCSRWVGRWLGWWHSTLIAQLQPGTERVEPYDIQCMGTGGTSQPQTAQRLRQKRAKLRENMGNISDICT